ncbi:MAG: hypothetical protein AAF623_00265 [Planctomycetota bacterium]
MHLSRLAILFFGLIFLVDSAMADLLQKGNQVPDLKLINAEKQQPESLRSAIDKKTIAFVYASW